LELPTFLIDESDRGGPNWNLFLLASEKPNEFLSPWSFRTRLFRCPALQSTCHSRPKYRIGRHCNREAIEDANPAAEERQIKEQLAGWRFRKAQYSCDHCESLFPSRIGVAVAALHIVVWMQIHSDTKHAEQREITQPRQCNCGIRRMA
jgi:hypothetical protein